MGYTKFLPNSFYSQLESLFKFEQKELSKRDVAILPFALELSLVDCSYLVKHLILFTAVSPCAVNPCKNGGECLPIAGDDFICKCREGFFGDTCGKG